MIVMTVTEFSRNLKKALNRIEEGQEEIVLVRSKKRIGRIIPGEPFLTAREAFTDLVGTLTDEAAEGWIEAGRNPETLVEEKADPWAG